MRNRWFDQLSLNEPRRLHDAAVGRQRRRAPFQERDSRFHFAQTAQPSPNIDGVMPPDVRHPVPRSNRGVRSPQLERGAQLCRSSRPVPHRRQGRAGPSAPRGTAVVAWRAVVSSEMAVIECNWHGTQREECRRRSSCAMTCGLLLLTLMVVMNKAASPLPVLLAQLEASSSWPCACSAPARAKAVH